MSHCVATARGLPLTRVGLGATLVFVERANDGNRDNGLVDRWPRASTFSTRRRLTPFSPAPRVGDSERRRSSRGARYGPDRRRARCAISPESVNAAAEREALRLTDSIKALVRGKSEADREFAAQTPGRSFVTRALARLPGSKLEARRAAFEQELRKVLERRYGIASLEAAVDAARQRYEEALSELGSCLHYYAHQGAKRGLLVDDPDDHGRWRCAGASGDRGRRSVPNAGQRTARRIDGRDALREHWNRGSSGCRQDDADCQTGEIEP